MGFPEGWNWSMVLYHCLTTQDFGKGGVSAAAASAVPSPYPSSMGMGITSFNTCQQEQPTRGGGDTVGSSSPPPLFNLDEILDCDGCEIDIYELLDDLHSHGYTSFMDCLRDAHDWPAQIAALEARQNQSLLVASCSKDRAGTERIIINVSDEEEEVEQEKEHGGTYSMNFNEDKCVGVQSMIIGISDDEEEAEEKIVMDSYGDHSVLIDNSYMFSMVHSDGFPIISCHLASDGLV